MTSHRCGQGIASARRVLTALPRRRVVLVVAALIVGLGPTKLATAFLQVPDEPSPASGTAQVIAQGVVDVPDGDLRWQITEETAPLPANATETKPARGIVQHAEVEEQGGLEDHRNSSPQRQRAFVTSQFSTYPDFALGGLEQEGRDL